MRLLTSSLAAALLATATLAHADPFARGSRSDPAIRSVQFLAHDQRHFSALTELLKMSPSGEWQKLPADYQWLLAQAYVDFGMRSGAAPLYRHLAVTTTDHLLLARSRLRMAELEYQRGYTQQARNTLMAMREQLPNEVILGWQDLLSRVLMAEGRYGEAEELLGEFKNGDQQSPYTRYNLAIALLNNGKVERGRDILDRVGKLRIEDLETLALRDRANLTLGWNFLKAQQGASAKPAFYQVRSSGPFSNRALLGLGWAELAPQGTQQKRELPEDQSPFTTFSSLGSLLRPGFLESDAVKRAQLNFKLGNISKDEATALSKAMVAWVELISRDPMDPAVQEAWLAIPYSLDRLGAHTQALQYYERAVTELEKNRKRIELARNSLKNNTMVETIVRRDLDAESGWEWKLKDLPDTPETYYLQNLLAEHRFQEALKNYRDVRLLARNLDAWMPRLAQAELVYVGRTPAESADTADLFRRAKRGWREPWEINVRLRMEEQIAAPGSYADDFENTPIGPMQLTLASTPSRFNGPYERIQNLRARKERLREQLAIAGGEQAKLLEAMAAEELEGQRKAVEKYLVEARFALARLYDRALKKDKPVETPKPESEGLLNRFLNIFGGGSGK